MKSREFLVFMFFFMVSAFFWVLLAVKDVTERDIYVKIVMVNQPEGHIFCLEGNDTVRVTVRDNGYNILSYLTFFNKVNPVRVDFKKYDDIQNRRVWLDNTELAKLVKEQLEKTTEVVAIKPKSLSIAYFGENEYKKVAVAVDGQITPAENYFISSIRTQPESVKVYTNELYLQQLKSIPTKRVTYSDLSESIDKVVPILKDKDDAIIIEPKEVLLQVAVDILANDTVDVPITAINEPEGKQINTWPKKVKVIYVVPSSQQKNITKDLFSVYVDYNDVGNGNVPNSLPLHMGDPPLNVKRVSLSEDSVAITIGTNHEKE